MSTGKVKWFNNEKKYGFINAEDGKELFVHFSDIQTEGYKTLKKGDLVEFDVEQGPKGEKAVRVRKIRSEQPKRKVSSEEIPKFIKKKRFIFHPGNGAKRSA